MSKMENKVLIIIPFCEDFEVGKVKGTPFSSYLAKEWKNRGYTVEIICWKGGINKFLGYNFCKISPPN